MFQGESFGNVLNFGSHFDFKTNLRKFYFLWQSFIKVTESMLELLKRSLRGRSILVQGHIKNPVKHLKWRVVRRILEFYYFR